MLLPVKTKSKAELDRVNSVVEYIFKTEKYSFENTLSTFGLMDNAKHQGSNVIIECPFHVDYSPSCSIDFDRKIYKCFSCGRGGSYLDFLLNYENIVNSNSVNFYTMLENILRKDYDMQCQLSIPTIFTTVNLQQSDNFSKRRKFKIDSVNKLPENILELANKVKNEKKDLKDIVKFVELMQRGLDYTTIYDMMFGETKKREENSGKLKEEFENLFKED